ncbi:LptF/LptG family permease [uncultured Phascolarctobacterium sp.]|uniref:LptF/LptG family permease n=1 Tax=uncultured Phascolarctobacterium sp. TaxID=512296 RepID=UPI00261EFB7F|nr:LptF/LptG family permease [uncultured Phascolarctobacterium sp.]
MRLRLLDRYVLKELLYPFIFGIAAFSSIFIASTMLYRITQYITKYGASLETIARLFMYNLPEIINYTFPMSMLLAALMAFGKLSGSSEITAMKAGGVSYYRIVAPVLVVGFIVSMFSLVWAEKMVPFSKAESSRILNEEIKHNSRPSTQDHIVIKTINGTTQRVTYANKFDEKQGKMTDITIEEFNKGKIARIQTAKEGYWENGTWRIVNGNVFALDDQEGVQSSAKFTEQIIPLNFSPKQISWEQKEPEEMTIRELREYISILEKQQTPAYKQWCEIFMRINIPLASFFFAMIGACLGTQKQRTSSSIGLGISIIVIFIYYAVMTFTSGLGKGGALPPFLACAIPNILCLGIGLYLMKKKSV